MMMLLLLLLLFFLVDPCRSIGSRDAPPSSSYSYVEKFIQQPVDHFSPYSIDGEFSMRYLFSDEFYKPGVGPILFYAGNEDNIEGFAQATGFQWELAKKFHGLVIFAEHRYYGKSVINNTALPFQFLTSEQVLADFAGLLEDLKDRYRKENPKIIAIGGSFGGMLAAWLRQKYSWLVDAALASSAPVAGFDHMNAPHLIYDIISSNFRECAVDVGLAFQHLWDQSSSITQQIKDEFHLCHAPASEEDNAALIGYIQSAFTEIATLNYPYPVSFIGYSVPANPARAACALFNQMNGTTIHGLAAVVDMIFPTNSCRSLEDRFEAYLPGLMLGPWTFQRCTDIVLPSQVESSAPLFMPCSQNFKYNCWNDGIRFSEFCKRKFGDKVISTSRHAPARHAFGGLHTGDIGDIFFTNGDLDPWFSGGVTQQQLDAAKIQKCTSRLMRGAAHHLDLRASNAADPIDVVNTRKEIEEWIKGRLILE